VVKYKTFSWKMQRYTFLSLCEHITVFLALLLCMTSYHGNRYQVFRIMFGYNLQIVINYLRIYLVMYMHFIKHIKVQLFYLKWFQKI